MTNHYHLLVETPDANLSKGMRELNGVYIQHVNRKHGRVGHLLTRPSSRANTPLPGLPSRSMDTARSD